MKLNWKWPVLVVSVFVFMFYNAYTNNVVLTMRHLSLGQPDPWYFLIGFWAIILSFWFSFVAIWQNKSTEICHNLGSTCVNTLEPIAIIDPLDYYKVDDRTRRKVKEAIKNSWKFKDYLPEEGDINVRELGIVDLIRKGGDIQEYQSAVDAMKPIGLYPDGGLKILGVQGMRWWVGGTSVLVVSPEWIKPHGDGGVCVASVEAFKDLDQLQNLPPFVIKAVYDNIPQFIPGKHTILYGHNPHEKAVRARVERNATVKDNDLAKYPKYVWTLGVIAETIDSEKRDAWLDDLRSTLQSEVSEQNGNLKKWEEHEARKKPQPFWEAKEEESDGKS